MQLLRSYFHQRGICEKDLNELQEALTLEPKLEANGKFGKNVAAWIGKMVGKALSGTWVVGSDVCSAILTNAIMNYYGMH